MDGERVKSTSGSEVLTMSNRDSKKDRMLATAVIVFILALCVVASLQGQPVSG